MDSILLICMISSGFAFFVIIIFTFIFKFVLSLLECLDTCIICRFNNHPLSVPQKTIECLIV